MLRSRAITQGVQRSPNRAMLRAVGFGDEDFNKPIIGIANGYSTITPCNIGLNELAIRSEQATRLAGAMPQMFGTITVSDGISMGTEGMKYSLVSREVIADSIETVCRGANLDAVICVGGCDKNMPGALIAMVRLDIPSIFVYGGTIKPGHLDGKDLTVVSSFEAVGQHSAGSINLDQLTDIEKNACPGFGSCGGMYTANTMSSAIEAMGMSLPYSSTMSNEDREKELNTQKSAQALFPMLEKNITPKDILPRHSGHEARGMPLVKAVCDRLKVPNEHRNLALVVTEFHLICHKSLELKPITLLKLLKSIGALKSEKKLDDFLECCIADARGRKGFEDREYPPAAYLRQAREKLLKVKVKDLANSGLSGTDIGEQLQQRQIEALQQFKNEFQLS